MSRRRPYPYCDSRRTPYLHKKGFIERLLAFLRALPLPGLRQAVFGSHLVSIYTSPFEFSLKRK
jgi:hypothetical protein